VGGLDCAERGISSAPALPPSTDWAHAGVAAAAGSRI